MEREKEKLIEEACVRENGRNKNDKSLAYTKYTLYFFLYTTLNTMHLIKFINQLSFNFGIWIVFISKINHHIISIRCNYLNEVNKNAHTHSNAYAHAYARSTHRRMCVCVCYTLPEI